MDCLKDDGTDNESNIGFRHTMNEIIRRIDCLQYQYFQRCGKTGKNRLIDQRLLVNKYKKLNPKPAEHTATLRNMPPFIV
jgi:hypothetical protein